MAKDKNTLEKHRREVEKRRKAEEKRESRRHRKERPAPAASPEVTPGEEDADTGR